MPELRSVPETETDQLLREAGCDLRGEYEHMVSVAGFEPGSYVLDLGTGSGRMAAVLSRAGYSVVSGDIDPEALDRTRAALGECGISGVALLLLNGEDMPFRKASCASIICANAIHHMSDPQTVIAEMTRVCRADGRLMIIEFNDNGFEMIEKIHTSRQRGEHSRGLLSSQAVDRSLSDAFASVEYHQLKLNDVWIASDLRPQSGRNTNE